jgi:AraC-like DNA-binding protein
VDARALVEETLSEMAILFGRNGANSPRLPADMRARAVAHINQHLASRSLNPETVANSLRVSRSQLYELFAETGGVSKYIWTRRLAEVHAALTRGSETRSLTELAYDHGFANPAHLSSLFRRTYGFPPSRLRQR